MGSTTVTTWCYVYIRGSCAYIVLRLSPSAPTTGATFRRVVPATDSVSYSSVVLDKIRIAIVTGAVEYRLDQAEGMLTEVAQAWSSYR